MRVCVWGVRVWCVKWLSSVWKMGQNARLGVHNVHVIPIVVIVPHVVYFVNLRDV